jgi:hypothetical protein
MPKKPLERSSSDDEGEGDVGGALGVPATRNEHRILYLQPCPTKLKPFNPDSLILKPGHDDGYEPDKLILFFGKRRTGKSFSMRSLMGSEVPALGPGVKLYQVFPAGLVITGTKMNQFWQTMFPEAFVHESLDVLPRFMEMQKAFVKEWNRHPEWQEGPLYRNPYRIVIIDDMVGDHNFKDAESIRQMFVKGRHYKCLVMISTQYAKLVSTIGRDNVDLLMIFFQSTLRSKETIAEEYLSMVDKYDAMALIDRETQVDEKSEQRKVLVWDNMRLVNDPSEKLLSYSPTEPEEFLVGNEAYWTQGGEPERYQAWARRRAARKKAFKPPPQKK